MFLYNWQVREDWFEWCKTIPEEELLKERTGGMKSIINNLYHVIDCEQLWVNHMREQPVNNTSKNSAFSLNEVIKYSDITKLATKEFLESLSPDYENRTLKIQSKSGISYSFTYGKVIRHIASHEIHHIGQISVWSREIGLKPVSSDLLTRDYLGMDLLLPLPLR
ncbi:DinB family protein [Evansella sp. LMS18]|jgi:uncharacterized damage-inducible protein DinB|uniref:DinB family protein n=1 Tax=Evansella sp. LMS18 TaxID=2924033 RepID=UPI0020D02FD4|nr:DinB family protein [Evansella sp. LMS18]UTR13066.1 DinB family protein [Evansella sp. LMS18]